MNREKRIEYALQFIMVILGVFLGMMASNWNEERAFDHDRKNLLTALRSELQDNLDYLSERKEKDITPFLNSLDSISNVLKNTNNATNNSLGEASLTEKIPKFPGFGKSKFEDAMFQATKFSNMLSNIDIELLKQITKAYNLQYNIEDERQTINQKYMAISPKTKFKELHSLMWVIMKEYFEEQYRLIDEYKTTINMIDTAINP